jgi:hypothetical protein
VSWIPVRIHRDAFDPDMIKVLNGQHTVQDFTAPDAVTRLRAIAETARGLSETTGPGASTT